MRKSIPISIAILLLAGCAPTNPKIHKAENPNPMPGFQPTESTLYYYPESNKLPISRPFPSDIDTNSGSPLGPGYDYLSYYPAEYWFGP
jgi:hypothetical protein